ncbi:hypothetical protein N8902_01920 [Flavobacteriaceae bacterium]|nr:hypothetical protein [Flavobacteriaceae bacterium]
MKKGLLSILAASLLVVGCQDYDDQFSSLESQISALATTVAGLSEVQTKIAELAGTVGSLSTTVNGLGDAIDTAVSDGLADIQTDIDTIEAAVADVASSEEVSTLADAVSDAQGDLTDLLAASSVFTGDVVVNSPNTLDAFLAMKASLAIVNGNVNISVSTSMDQTKVQELMDSILTIVKDLTYDSDASSIAETTFDNLTGVQSITITQGGGIRFPNLISATNIDMKDDFESTVGVIHFGSLTSITQFETDGTADVIEFSKATELHLTSLAYYPNASLTIVTDEGAAMPFALDDVDADGDTLDDGLTLDITGPASFSVSNIADGSITLTDVATVSLTDFKGAVTLAGDVESFTSNSLVSLSVTAGAAIETVDVTGAIDPDATTAATKLGPAISLDTLSDLETVTIAGIASSVNIGDNGNLTALTISADVAGAITIDNNTDLETVTLTGAKAYSLDVDTNSDLAALTVDLTWRGNGVLTVIDGTLDVTDNESLESLTVSSDNLENLTVTGNDDLTTVDFTGVTTIGATGTAVVNIYDNDFTATKITDASDGTTDVANGASGDLGSITTTSGMETLKTYLTALAADTDSAAAVYFDTVESFIAEDDSETPDVVYSSNTAENAGTVLLLTAKNVTTPGQDAIKAKFSALLPGIVAGDTAEIWANGVQIVPVTTLGNNPVVNAALIASATNVATANSAGVTLSATGNASASIAVEFVAESSSTSEYSRVGAVNGTGGVVAKSDMVTLSLSTGESVSFSNVLTTGETDIVTELSRAWTAKYSNSASMVRWNFISAATAGERITFQGKDRGTNLIGTTMTISLSPVGGATALSNTTTNFGYVIGNDNSLTIDVGDNQAEGTGVVVTLEAQTAGANLSEIGAVSTANSLLAKSFSYSLDGITEVDLESSYAPNETYSNVATTANVYPSENRADVQAPDGAIAEVADDAVSFSRISWL